MVERGFGWLPDDPVIVADELERKGAELLVGATAPLSNGAVNYVSLLASIPDQRGTSSCTGQALATALFLTAAVLGMPIPMPSAKGLYDFGRDEDRPYVDPIDDGARPLSVVRCASDKGLVADADWPILFYPDGSSNINERPPIDIYQKALAAKLGDYYRIPSGPGASLLIRAALVRGFCPIFKMPVDEAFMRWTSSAVYPGRSGAVRGYHMQAIAGFGDGTILVPGSWGPYWADGGVIAIDNDYVDSGECADIIVATVIPALT